MFDLATHATTLEKDLKVGPNCPLALCQCLINIISNNWDAFNQSGICCPVLGFEDYFNTSKSTPIPSQQPTYSLYKQPIMNKFLDNLKHNGLLCKDNRPFTLLLLCLPQNLTKKTLMPSTYISCKCASTINHSMLSHTHTYSPSIAVATPLKVLQNLMVLSTSSPLVPCKASTRSKSKPPLKKTGLLGPNKCRYTYKVTLWTHEWTHS